MTIERIEVKFAADAIDATGEFKGYGAVFGNVDSHGDIIEPGAFKKSLSEWKSKGRLPSMKLMHGAALNPFADDLPVGKWTKMEEDGRGLYVEGKLSGLDTDLGRRIHGLMKDAVLDGLSIGYMVTQFSPGMGDEVRRRLEHVNLREVSLVDDPSNERARITAVKAAAEIKTIREFEQFLRDVGGYSNTAAKAIASGGFKASEEPRDEEEEALNALAARIRASI
jgi:HK97 family phage prohead protease